MAAIRVIAGALLLLFGVLFSYGFLASFEPNVGYMWKLVYALLVLVSVYGGYRLIRSGIQLLNQRH